jgi:arylsulfatase
MPHVPLNPGSEFQGKSKRGLYGDVIEEIDWAVGEILKTLKANGLAENTLVWFTSDNGPWIIKGDQAGSAGLFRDGKGSTWEGGQREPSIAWWPGKIAPGSVEMNLGATKDIYTTALLLAGAKIPTDRIVDGADLRGNLNSAFGLKSKEETFYYFGFDNTVFAVRQGKWKLHIRTHSQTGETYFDDPLPLLFDLDTDPSEKYNFATENPERVKQLEELIQKFNEELAANPSFYDKD